MTQLAYLLCVSRAETATALHKLRTEASNDTDLNAREKSEVTGAVGKKFSQLNAAIVNQTPRSSQVGWIVPVRIPAAIHAK